MPWVEMIKVTVFGVPIIVTANTPLVGWGGLTGRCSNLQRRSSLVTGAA